MLHTEACCLSPLHPLPLLSCVTRVVGCSVSFPVIPYHVVITTGAEFDSDTDSRVYVIISGPQKLTTGRLWLDLPDGQTEFADASVEKFSVMGIDVEEVKKVEVTAGLRSGVWGVVGVGWMKSSLKPHFGDPKPLFKATQKGKREIRRRLSNVSYL